MGKLFDRARLQAEKGLDFATMIADAEDEVGHKPLHAPEAAILRGAWKAAWPIRKVLEERRDLKRAPAYREPAR